MVAGDLRTKRNIILACIFVIAICLRLAMSMYYFDISGDKIYQTAAAQSLVSGKGYTVPSVDPLDLDRVIDKPMILWPPLYSVLLAGLMKLDISTIMASFLLDSINNIIFLILIYRICVLLNFPFWLSMLVILFKATEINEIITSSTATDYMGLNLWLATIITAMSYLEKPKFRTAAIFILLNALSPWLRYASIPLVLVLPFVMLIAGTWKKNRYTIQLSMVSGITAVVSTALLLYYNHSRSGAFFYVLETTKGFFPENLLHLPPIVWTSIINVNFPLTQISLRTGIYYGDLNIALKITSALLLLALLVYVLRSSNWKQIRTNPNYFFLLAVTLSVATLVSLALLSITRGRNYQVDRFWTYMEDNRYMILVTTTLMFYLIYEFIVKRKGNWIGYVLVFLLLAETAHGIWVMTKRPIYFPSDSSFNSGSPLTNNLFLTRNKEAGKNKKELILIDEDYNMRGFAILNNIQIMDDPADLEQTRYKSAKNKRIFFRMPEGHEPIYKDFLSQPGVREIGILEKAVFFELDIPQ
jgi:hypothetical protein